MEIFFNAVQIQNIPIDSVMRLFDNKYIEFDKIM